MDTFDHVIRLASEMQWPFTFAIVAMAAGVAIPVMVLGVSRHSTRQARIRAKEETERARIQYTAKNVAIAPPRGE